MIRVGSGNVNACAPQESILSRAGVPDAGYGVAFPADTQGITTHMAQSSVSHNPTDSRSSLEGRFKLYTKQRL